MADMFRIGLIVGLFILANLSGCLGSGGAKGDPQDTGTPTGSPSPTSTTQESPFPTATTPRPTASATPQPTGSPGPGPTDTPELEFFLSYGNVSDQANTSSRVNITWRVEWAGDAEHDVNHTAIHWSNESVADEGLDDPKAYPNETQNAGPATNPNEYNASIAITTPGLYYFRAHAIIDQKDYWAHELVVNVTVGVTGKVVTVVIGGAGNGAGPLSGYDPDPVEIKLGDAVRWSNEDVLGESHTATSDKDAPAAFDTGDVEEGKMSNATVFTAVGEYPYHCDVHPDTMSGTVEVTAP